MTKKKNDLKSKLSEKANNAPAKKNGKGNTVYQLLERMKPEIERALPEHVNVERMTRIALTAVRTTPKLLQCKSSSLMAAIMTSAQLGLEPNTPLGEAYIIPYGNEAQFQLGYKGIISLAHRSGQYRSIYAHEIYENDEFEYTYGLHKDLKHTPAKEPEGQPVFYYAVYHLQNGGYDFECWPVEKVERHRSEYSQSYQSSHSPWKTNFDEMAKKTVLKSVLKYAPKSIEFSDALSQDGTVKEDIDADPEFVEEDYIDIDREGTAEKNTNAEDTGQTEQAEMGAS